MDSATTFSGGSEWFPLQAALVTNGCNNVQQITTDKPTNHYAVVHRNYRELLDLEAS